METLLEKAKRRPELWYPTVRIRYEAITRKDGQQALVLQQKWMSNHDREEWRDVEIVEESEGVTKQ